MADRIDSSVTFVVSHTVIEGKESAYEAWLNEIIPLCESYPGHLGTQVIRPAPGRPSKYTVIVRFDDHRHFENWSESEDRARMIVQVQPILEGGDSFQVKSGLDFWFTPDAVEAKVPPRWKQYLLTWSAIYPLALLVPVLWNPAFATFQPLQNYFLSKLLVTATMVALMVYLVMPRYTRAIHRWLFR